MYRGRKTVPLYIGIEPAAELQLRALYIRTYDKGDGDVTHDDHTRAARENRKCWLISPVFSKHYSGLVFSIYVVFSTKHVCGIRPRNRVIATCSKTGVIHFIDP